MLVRFLQTNRFFRKIIYKLGKARANDIVDQIKVFLRREDHMLDIGAGVCNVCETLLERGYRVVPLDVRDVSFVDGIKPVLYDGNKIPFDDNKFDIALLLMVLHHTPYPERIIKEAQRVSKKIVIIEDIYVNAFQKYLIYFFDSLLSLEFVGHPHTNKSDAQWKDMFRKLGLKLIDAKYSYSFLIFKQATYYLER